MCSSLDLKTTDAVPNEHWRIAESKTNHYLSLAYLIAMQSEDESTHVGAVIVGPDKEIRSTGYNGLPRGCKVKPERQERPQKYKWFEHAERNAIYNAARMGTSLSNCMLFVNALPCADCARAIIQSGIKTIVYHQKFEEGWTTRPQEDRNQIIEMLKESNISVISYIGSLVKIINGQRDNEKFSLE